MEILIAAGVILLIVIIMYNGLINKKNQVENVFAGMDAQLKKRYGGQKVLSHVGQLFRLTTLEMILLR